MFRNVPEPQTLIFRAICEKQLDFPVTNLLTLPETFSETRSKRPTPWARKETLMRRKIPSSRWIAVAVAVGCVAFAAALTTSTPAATDSPVKIAAGHKCLVMTGSGDPTFIKNFNPYTATGLPSGSFVQGAMYEPLIITAEGG